MSEPVAIDRDAIGQLCRRYGVSRLALFGSAATTRFDASTSDIDFLVEFRADVDDAFGAYFGLKRALEDLFDRPVDLVSPKSLRNPYFAASVRETEEELYAA